MVRVFDHLFPTSKADIWSLWVGRGVHTLVTCVAEPKSDPQRGRYLAKFRSYEEGGMKFGLFYLNSIFFSSFRDGEWNFFLLSLLFFREDNSTLLC